jgi:pyridoxal phosphate enzyme (YggS family)
VTLAARWDSVQHGIAEAALRVGRDPGDITTIVVTKFHPASLVRELAQLGVGDVGENRHQEAEAKAAELADLPLRWHFIGQLQSNKARAVRAYAHAVHSVDRASVVTALGRAEPGVGGILDCFVQVNLTTDPGRGGIAPEGILALAEQVAAEPSLRLRGLMAVAPLDEHPRDAFARVRGYSDSLRQHFPEATDLSMGMSHDYADAIAEGATHLRIGSAITGERPAHG